MQNDRTNVSYLLPKYERDRSKDKGAAIKNVEPSVSFFLFFLTLIVLLSPPPSSLNFVMSGQGNLEADLGWKPFQQVLDLP
jgi:hypothetical protein